MNLVRARVAGWRGAGYPGVTATTLELLNYWRRDGRAFRPFFAQLEAVETIIFLTEARRDYLQGLDVPRDEPSDKQKNGPSRRAPPSIIEANTIAPNSASSALEI